MAIRMTLQRAFLSMIVLGIALLALPARGIQLSSAERSAVPAALEPALKGLDSPNAFERGNAVKALGLSHNPAVAPVLIDKLNDPDQAVGLYVAQALGEVTPASLLPELHAALRNGNPDVRWRAAMALGELGDSTAVGSLSVLLRDTDLMVQGNAAEALAKIGGETAIRALTGALDSESDSTVQAAMSGLETLGDQAVPGLADVMTSQNAKVRLDAATVLGYIATPAAQRALQLATIDQDPEVRAAVERALSQLSK
jgi:HEAT repeat protein